ncbi:hypothetical protein [Pseudoxanthomonas mexicana]|uniref:hypothetical protein n=1 Tax=Pseudoxanthomonas mexicana TaxID=128785 RepID=UPI00398B762E
MNTDYFFVQDAAGTRCRVDVLRAVPALERGTHQEHGPVYQLEDGTMLRRLDRDTFQVPGTGAVISRVD